MKKILKKYGLMIGVFASIFVITLALTNFGGEVFAATKDDVCQGVGLVGGGTGCDGAGADTTINKVIKTVISLLSFIIGFIAIVMVIIGGFKYITSGGDSNSVNSAKNTILYAIIGLVIVALAQIIVRFVLSNVG